MRENNFFNNVELFDVKMMGIKGFGGVYIIHGEKPVLIDTGGLESSDKLVEFLKGNKIVPQYIIITHNHHDHIGGVNPVRDAFGYNTIAVITGAAGKESLAHPNVINSYFTPEKLEPVRDVTVFEDGETLRSKGMELQILYTPGHSSDSISIYDTNNKILFPGDLPGDWLWNRTYLTPSVTPDFSEDDYYRSTEKLMSFDLECTAMPHFGFFTRAKAYSIHKDQQKRYEEWKKILVPLWKENKSSASLIPAIRNFLSGSPFEALEGFDMVVQAFAEWCVLGYKNSGNFI